MQIKPIEDIQKAIELSLEIFAPVGIDRAHPSHSPEDWVEKMQNENGILLGAYEGEKPVGYIFGYEKGPSIYHFSLGGVLPEYRRRGIMSELYLSFEKQVRESGYKEVTANTFRDIFPGMHKTLPKWGFELLEETSATWWPLEKETLKCSYEKALF